MANVKVFADKQMDRSTNGEAKKLNAPNLLTHGYKKAHLSINSHLSTGKQFETCGHKHRHLFVKSLPLITGSNTVINCHHLHPLHFPVNKTKTERNCH